jgi:hypothetical protein
MAPLLTRRDFIKTTTAAAGLTLAPALTRAAAGNKQFSFVLLGDLHYDKLEHHDMAWVQKDKPNDIRQIEGYTRNSREVTPLLFARVRETIAELNRTPATRVAFVLQAGDLVEGLCWRSCATRSLAFRCSSLRATTTSPDRARRRRSAACFIHF